MQALSYIFFGASAVAVGGADVLAYIWNNGRRYPKRAQSLCASDIRYGVSVYNTLSLQSCVGMGNFTIET